MGIKYSKRKIIQTICDNYHIKKENLMRIKKKISRDYFIYFPFFLVFLSLYFLSLNHYLLFHNIVELYSIAIAGGIFIVSWNTKEYTESKGLVFLGLSYLFVSIIDFFHLMTYKGMPVFGHYSLYVSVQLWIIGRFLEAGAMIFFVLIGHKIKRKYDWIVIVLLLGYTVLSLLSVFFWRIFPECFLESTGQTPFKIWSEYIICFILLLSIVFLIKKRDIFNRIVFIQILISLIFTILSEIMFTLYTDVYGIKNAAGHLFKVISFYLIYRSVIVNTLKIPMETIYFKLNKGYMESQKANDTKNKFFEIIAHDLKGPFTSILGYIELLDESCSFMEKNKKRTKYIHHLKESSKAVYQLLEDLLDWGRLQAEDIIYDAEYCDIKEIINEAVSEISYAAIQKKIKVDNNIHDSAPICVDKNMIVTAIRNILSNSIKFSYSGGNITISYIEENGKIYLKISDEGIGIPAHQIDDIFKITSKHSTMGTNGEIGTGLGMILCKELIEKNNGRISVQSEINKGTTFIIVFELLKES